VLILIPLISRLPAYDSRLHASYSQVRLLPVRLGTSYDDYQASTSPSYPGILQVRGSTFQDAVIVISDDPRDGDFASVAHLAYFLYPRILLRRAELRRTERQADFVLVTPHFPAELPDSLRADGLSMFAVSPRDVAYNRERPRP